MVFEETPLTGAFLVGIEPVRDSRGFFARSFCARDFERQGLRPAVAQCNISFNARKGTVRGLHLSVGPSAEAKLVRCTSGAIRDVIVDLRPHSPTYLKHFGVELTSLNRRALYIPVGFAHGMQTLEDDTEVFYQMTECYDPGAQRGYRYDDPAFGIDWPLEVTVLSDKDSIAPYLRDAQQ